MNNAAFVSESITKSTTWVASSAGPFTMDAGAIQLATVWRPESSATVWLLPFVNDGGSFTGVTVTANVWAALVSSPPLAMPPLSWSETVTVDVPFAFAAGVNDSVAAGTDRRTGREDVGHAGIEEEVDRLTRLVGRPGADGRRPAGYRLRRRSPRGRSGSRPS